MLNVKEKELKAAYVKEAAAIMARDNWGVERWRDYFNKKIGHVVELENGDLYGIEKPTIETRFCYGYGTFESDEGARRMAARTRTDGGEIFKEDNLKKVDEWIESLNDEMYIPYTRTAYNSAPENSKIKSLEFASDWEWAAGLRDREGVKALSDADKRIILEAYKEERKDFEKRLDAYLKRYGTTKLKTWTYWQDE